MLAQAGWDPTSLGTLVEKPFGFFEIKWKSLFYKIRSFWAKILQKDPRTFRIKYEGFHIVEFCKFNLEIFLVLF